MAAITVVPARIRPLEGTKTRRFAAGAALTTGMFVYIHTDGTVKPVDADALETSKGRGVVVAVSTWGATTAAVGDYVDVAVWGPVETGATGLTVGAEIFSSTTEGAADQTAPAASGDYPFCLGYVESEGIIFVMPQSHVPTVNP